MSRNGYILLIVGVFLFWYYSLKLQTAKALLIRYLLPQQIRVSNGALKWSQPVVITNPTATPITLQQYSVQLLLEGYPIGTAYGVIPTTIIQGQDTTILAAVTIPITALISAIPDIRNAGKSIDFRFVGTITAEFITIPVDTYIRLSIPKL